ncbi:MFS family permease [Cytobacillus eiseniae]|uniref:MFS family permease n=1 Tax=Cytobacillus eiseniae TaxID=762947 RepID=A0ABS4RH75_9BACI|nr:MFS transporter [Cytobacillus eiseniae]MBP2241781.1 MFS family permease [Cytobacillus eiseniae]
MALNNVKTVNEKDYTYMNKISPRNWLIFIVFGLIGQIAWTVENMYLNLYIYKTVTYNPDAIAIMVAASAVVATLTTLTMGALSDKVGKRKVFMSVGYIIWGISIIAFGYISKETVAVIFPGSNVIVTTVIIIILLDCLMTYIGSTANDAAFQAWITDVTTPANRGRAEGLLATMPLLGMLVVFGVLDSFTQQGNWKLFFWIIGLTVTAAGIISIFLIKDRPIERKDSHYIQDLIYGFRLSTIKNNMMLYIIFGTVCLLGIAQQVFLPYFIIYFEFFIGIADYAILLGIVLILSSVISIIGGQFVDRYGKKKFLLLSVLLYILGMFTLFILGRTSADHMTLTYIFTIIFAVVMMGSYLVSMVILNSMARDLLPVAHIGVFSGIRMIFFIMIPMVIGPFIGSTIIKNSQFTYTDEFGISQLVPTPEIYLGGAIIGLLALIPIFLILKRMNKDDETI